MALHGNDDGYDEVDSAPRATGSLRKDRSDGSSAHSAERDVGCHKAVADDNQVVLEADHSFVDDTELSFKQLTISEEQRPPTEFVIKSDCKSSASLPGIESSKETCTPVEPAAGEALQRLKEKCFRKNEDGDTYLHLSVIYEIDDDVRKIILLAMCVELINDFNNLYQTPLLLAVLVKNPKITRMLVCAGASTFRVDMRGNTPLHVACELRNLELIEAVLKEPDLEEEKQWFPNRPYPFPDRLPLNEICKVTNYRGYTPIHISYFVSDKQGIKMLLKYGADINAQDQCSRRTILHFAVAELNHDMVTFIVEECHADINALTGSDQTPLDIAYYCRNQILINYLESKGSRLNEYHSDSDSDSDEDSMELSDDEQYDDIRFDLPANVHTEM